MSRARSSIERTADRSSRCIAGTETTVREWALAGVWGREVQVVGDGGALRYSRAPAGDNAPLAMWSNRWSTMPVHAFPQIRLPRPDGRAALDTMPGSDVPVIRQPFDESDRLPFWATRQFTGNHLYDVVERSVRATQPGRIQTESAMRSTCWSPHSTTSKRRRRRTSTRRRLGVGADRMQGS